VISKNNDLMVEGNLILDKIEFTQEEESSRRDLLRTFIALIQGGKEKASLPIRILTKMDSPKLDFSSIKENIPLIGLAIPALAVKGLLDEAKETTTESTDEVKDITDIAVEGIKDVVDIIGDIFTPLKEGSQ